MPFQLVTDGAALDRLLHSRTGAVGRYMETRSAIFQMAAIQDCPKRTNKLSESINRRWLEDTGELTIIVVANQPYAAYVHEGTKAHVIVPKKPGGVLHFVVDGQDVFTRKVNHPGTKGVPFLRRNLPLIFG